MKTKEVIIIQLEQELCTRLERAYHGYAACKEMVELLTEKEVSAEVLSPYCDKLEEVSLEKKRAYDEVNGFLIDALSERDDYNGEPFKWTVRSFATAKVHVTIVEE